MKRAIVCALLMLAIACGSSALYAQQDNAPQGPPAGRRMMMAPEQRLQHMTRMLDLTSDQQEKIRPILENESQQMQTLRQDTTIPDQDKGTKLRELHQSTNDQIWAVLNPEQQKKWQAMQDQRMQRMGRGNGDHGGAPPAAAPNQTNPQ